MTLLLALRLAGALHFAILTASALVPRTLRWRENLAPLPPFLRRLFWVYGAFIVGVIIGFGALALALAPALAAGSPLARSFCGFVALFWLARLAVQWFVFNPEPYLTSTLLRVGYHALTAAFLFLCAVYGWAALAPDFTIPL